MKNKSQTDHPLAFICVLCTVLFVSRLIGSVWITNILKQGKMILRYLLWFIRLSIMRQISNLHAGLIIIKRIYCFRRIVTVRRRIRIRNSVGEKIRICQRSWIERRRIIPVVPVVGGIVLLMWVLIRSGSIRVIVVGLGTNDLSWTAGRKPFGLKWRRRWRFGRRVVDWFHGGWNCRLMRIESRNRKDLSGVVSICKFKTKDES
jgi:hypothetical protein